MTGDGHPRRIEPPAQGRLPEGGVQCKGHILQPVKRVANIEHRNRHRQRNALHAAPYRDIGPMVLQVNGDETRIGEPVAEIGEPVAGAAEPMGDDHQGRRTG